MADIFVADLEKITLQNLVKRKIESIVSSYEGFRLRKDVLGEVEEVLIRQALATTKGNKSKAALLLGMDRNYLARKLKSYRTEG